MVAASKTPVNALDLIQPRLSNLNSIYRHMVEVGVLFSATKQKICAFDVIVSHAVRQQLLVNASTSDSVAIHSICSLLSRFPPRSDRIGELFQDFDRSFPANASVSDADTLLQAGWTLWRDTLAALVDVGFDHDAYNTGLAFPKLVANDLRDLGLIPVIFVRVPCGSVSILARLGTFDKVSDSP